MKNATLLFAAICVLQANAISAIEISGYVIRKNQEPSPASVYINGEEIAVASDSAPVSRDMKILKILNTSRNFIENAKLPSTHLCKHA